MNNYCGRKSMDEDEDEDEGERRWMKEGMKKLIICLVKVSASAHRE